MSCYEWERGSITLPAKEYVRVRTNVITALNTHMNFQYEVALKMYDKVKEAKKGKRNFDISAFLRESECSWEIRNSLLSNNKLVKPKKKDFPILPTSKSCSFNDSELTVSFDNKKKRISWDVQDNNHSIDTADESFLGQQVMLALKSVTWTNQTGGYFISQNEYASDEGQGARVSRTFGNCANHKSKAAKMMRQQWS